MYIKQYIYIMYILKQYIYFSCPAHCRPLEHSSTLRRGNKLMQFSFHGCPLHRLPMEKTNANCQEAFAGHSDRPESCNSSSWTHYQDQDF